jgi:hypothetical protein
MLFQSCFFAIALIAGGPSSAAVHPSEAPHEQTRAADVRPASKPQAEAQMVVRFNQLAAALRDFSTGYSGAHSVDARKALAVRRAWIQFEAAESECRKWKGR